MIQSLKKQKHDLSLADEQVKVLSNSRTDKRFAQFLKNDGLLPLKPTSLEIFQINLGKMCNQVCKHCHVDAGPDRKEIMTKESLETCLIILKNNPSFNTVDLTGGAPEMNPNFRWFVSEVFKLGIKVIVRCNLTIILANPKYNDLPNFFKEHKVEVVSSLPYFTKLRTDAQRGDGVFGKSIDALKMLNDVGYGMPNSGLTLNLVYNPSGAFLPDNQENLERSFKQKLSEKFDIQFNSLYAITNLPISRFLEYLIQSENFDEYMDTLIENYNPTAAQGVMCRNTISVGWDGQIYDCDFNQMLELSIPESNHIDNFNDKALLNRNIITNQHCFGCTAGAGSSCGGTTA